MRTIIRDNYDPKNGDYHEKIIIDEARGRRWLFDCDGVFMPFDGVEVVNERGSSTSKAVSQKLFTDTANELEGADATLQQEIDELKNSPDVVDIVGTYADLQSYDTSTLGDKDVIRVLVDETHDDESSYYRWNATPQTWTFIGAVEGYYTRAQTDDLLDEKQDTLTAGSNIQISGNTISATDTTYTAGNGLDLTGTTFSADTTVLATQADLATKQGTLTAGANISIDSNNVISATDTTYSDFTGTDGATAGTAGLVPAPATTDAGKFLKADGTWDTAGSAVNVVQTTGTSTTDVMSQNATTSMVFADPSNKTKIQIGNNSMAYQNSSVAIGNGARTGRTTTDNNYCAIAIGAVAATGDSLGSGHYSIAIGGYSKAIQNYAVAIGAYSNIAGGTGVAIGGGYSSSNAARVNKSGGVAIGGESYANGVGSIALGYGSSTSTTGEMNIGSTSTSYGYNSSNYRLLSGVYDPQSAHDAATKGYVDGMITLTDTDPGEGAALAAGKFIAVYDSNS